ncbi:MAG: ORF6N domain-containing protein [Desulfobulbaceae bacterium]|nr:ORF6N domain-containing protein [Desulfobulbaceae bacterium]
MRNIIPLDLIERRIFFLRGEKVMIDRHLAELYDVETRILNQAVKRNKKRFPAEFMFQLSREERSEVITICDDLGQFFCLKNKINNPGCHSMINHMMYND